jgi:hypothetical protein
MRLDDRFADRQPHPHATGFRGDKRIEEFVDYFGIDARAGIRNRN